MSNCDKQIIIDDVDVSGCPCIQSNNIGDVVCVRLARTSLYCKGQPCYYKALERKEQECEELKIYIESNEQQVKEVETLVMDNDRLINELDQLKVENDSLKRQLQFEFDETLLQYSNELDRLKAENDELKVQNIKYMNGNIGYQLKNSLYKQTLTEIKEIATENSLAQVGYNPDWDIIIQKISECEGNDGR